MPTINIDNKRYDLNKISDEARAKIESSRFCDKKIMELEAELAVLRTARSAYLSVLPALLSDDALAADTEKKPATKRKAPAKKATAKKADESTKH